MTYTLNANKNEKTGIITYWVTNDTGKVISARSSKKEYVACSIDGKSFFSNLADIPAETTAIAYKKS